MEAMAQAYYDTGAGLNEEQSSLVAVHPRTMRSLSFPLSLQPVRQIRLDPLDRAGEFRLRRIRVTDGLGRVLYACPPESVQALHQIEALEVRNGGIEGRTASGADDPMLLVAIPHPLRAAVHPLGVLAWVPVAFAVFVLLALLAAWLLGHVRAWAERRLGEVTRRQRLLWFELALLLGAYLAVAIPIGWFSMPLPDVLHEADWVWVGLWRTLVLLGQIATIGAALFLGSVWLATRRTVASPPPQPGRWAWLVYALPAAAVGSLYLVAFWPGVMTTDSVMQWAEKKSGYLSDWHPAFHTLTIRWITALWDSPAAVGVVQIVAFAALVGWAARVFRGAGSSRRGVWFAALACAFLPAGGLLSVTLWKDVPYSLSFLCLNLIVVQIVLTRGLWLEGRARWLPLGVTVGLVALFRHNGIAAAFGTPFCLLFFYRRWWRPLALSLILGMGAWWVVRGPVYRALHVKLAPPAQNILIHPIAAHIVAGTPMSEEDARFLARIKPLNAGWRYLPESAVPLICDRESDWAFMDAHSDRLWPIYLRLTRQAPWVTLKHHLLVSALVWRIRPVGDLYISDIQPKGDSWRYIEPNGLGLRESPRCQGLTETLSRVYRDSAAPPWLYVFWSPAAYLYLFLLAVAVSAVRLRSWRILLIALPVLLHSSLLALVNVAADFRYQYPVYLAALAVGLPMLSASFGSGAKLGLSPNAARPDHDQSG